MEVARGFRVEISEVLKLISKTKTFVARDFFFNPGADYDFSLAVIGPGYAEHVLRIKVVSFPTVFMIPAVVGIALGALIIGSFLHKNQNPL